MYGKIEMSSFQTNYNHIEIQHIDLDMSQIVHKYLVW